MNRRDAPLARTVLILALAAGAVLSAGPSRFGLSDRIERHLLPEVTTGPAEPAWSPDGKWLAFAMHGDIWKVPADGGEAIALTRGPAYYFEPEWSPDGRFIAFTMDLDGNLDIGRLSADGSSVERLTTDRDVDIEPVWSRDGLSVYFASSRGRGFDIFRLRLSDKAVLAVVADNGDQIQPALSPDGQTLAYVSPVAGKLGTGGIWTRAIGGGAPTLVHYEESEYRMRPRWTPDGKAFLFGSDALGSNDIAAVPASGGNPIVLTLDAMGEFSAAPAPGGGSFAFISNRAGPMTLYVAPISGGLVSSWRKVNIASRRSKIPTGHLRGRVVGPDSRPMPARVQLVGSDGRGYAPDDGFARVIAVSEVHYFHTDGEFDVELPAGVVKVDALRGFEYVPASGSVEVKPGATSLITLTLRHLVDAAALSWYSGDTHAHDFHQGRFGLTRKALFAQSLAEDLHVSNMLVHMDGTRLMGRLTDLTGEPDPISTPTHAMQFGEEYRGSLGNLGLLGISKFVLPFSVGSANTAFAQVEADVAHFDGARAQNGIVGFVHPYSAASGTAAGWATTLMPVDVALGRGDFYDVASLPSDERASAEMYYRLLNCGFRLAATGGTDNFPDVWRDPPVGTDRTYAKVPGRLSVAGWLAAVKAGRTFATTGPLVFLTVGGREPGDEIRLSEGDVRPVLVRVIVRSIAPIDRVEILVNGKPAFTKSLEGLSSSLVEFETQLPVPDGGWVAARVDGPPSRYVADSYAFALTSPVYVIRGGKTFVSHDDAKFLAEVVDAIWARLAPGPWRSNAERDAFKREIDQAKAVYVKLAGG